MRRLAACCFALVVCSLPSLCLPTIFAQTSDGLSWIWYPEDNPAEAAPAGTRYFRVDFNIPRPFANPTDEATLDITADDAFEVWFNGVRIGAGADPKRVFRFDVRQHALPGKNVVAVAATNKSGPAGLLVRLGYVPNGMSKLALLSNGQWRVAKDVPADWQSVNFVDKNWSQVRVLGRYGKVGPWTDLTWDAGGDDRFSVPPGFKVQTVVPANPNAKFLDKNLPFSLVNLTFDAKGRLLVSQERGFTLLCTEPDASGVFQSIKPYCKQVKNAQGMCWVKDALWLVGDGPQGTGLYRVRDTDGNDETDEVTLIHKFRGGMGEHGPHAIIHGPDDWLYLVIGNHAWAQPKKLADNSPLLRWPTGGMGPDQGKPGTTEDVLLPRLNDGRGHAANILAPGGTIWRLDHEGNNFSLVAAGFRNHYDACFGKTGELFTFDSDMEWDEGLPWYRAVRVCHCPPGADFVWRTGAANTPDYYIDSLPPMVETGRGSPVGVECYDHVRFPEPYRGNLFMADWAIGVIYRIVPRRAGASFDGAVERFCTGTPLNVTDVITGPDGALYFTIGGRGTEGGVFRIVYGGAPTLGGFTTGLTRGLASGLGRSKVDEAISVPQPLAPWSRARLAKIRDANPEEWAKRLNEIARGGPMQSPMPRMRALELLQEFGPKPDAELLIHLSRDDEENEDHPFIRSTAIWLLGVNGYPEGKDALAAALKDGLASVRRRACEALIRAGIEPPLDDLWPLLADGDRFNRTAARLVLQRINPEKWVKRLVNEPSDYIAMEAILALCKTNQAAPHARLIAERLRSIRPSPDDLTMLLDYLRVWQMVLIHTKAEDTVETVREKGNTWFEMFPHRDGRVNRELAILLTHLRRTDVITLPVHAKLLAGMLDPHVNRQQQIHYFYCGRLLHQGWTPEQTAKLLHWYEGTRDWRGGHSFEPFMENIFREYASVFSSGEVASLAKDAVRRAFIARKVLELVREEQLPPPQDLAQAYQANLAKGGEFHPDLRAAIINALGRHPKVDLAQAELRKLLARDTSQEETLVRAMIRGATAEDWAVLLKGVGSPSPITAVQCMEALKRLPRKPAADEHEPYRRVLAAANRLPPRERWKAVELLRHWGNKKFTPEDGDWKAELTAWSRWFNQSFPKEPPIEVVTAAPVSKWKLDELLAQIDSEPQRPDSLENGRRVFDKANCIKCHKFGSIGEGLGPDLTTLKARFKRQDVLESVLDPSKVVSDQYRGSVILTKKGQTITGLAAPQGDLITVLQLDGTKVTIRVEDVETHIASTQSAMPEKLFDELTVREIADLIRFLEADPPK
jgi:putative heme-binding domain-containing protein